LSFKFHRYVRKYEEKYARCNLSRIFDEFLSVRHPDYAEIERTFSVYESLPLPIDKAVRRISTRHSGLVIEIYSPEAAALEDLSVRLRELRESLRTLEVAEKKRGVLDVLKRLGPEALRPSGWEAKRSWETVEPPVSERVRQAKEDELDLLGKIRSTIWKTLDAWYWDARHAKTYSEREGAQTAWLKVGQLLAGDLRGIGPDDILDTTGVCESYYSRLFRLLRALQLLDAWPWAGSFASRISSVANACGVPANHLRDFLQVDSPDSESGPDASGLKPMPPEQAARIFTAEKFGLSIGRVRNILAEYWVFDSRK
jgi:hypothetical protein